MHQTSIRDSSLPSGITVFFIGYIFPFTTYNTPSHTKYKSGTSLPSLFKHFQKFFKKAQKKETDIFEFNSNSSSIEMLGLDS